MKGKISFQYNLNRSGDLNDKEILIARHYKLQGYLKYRAIVNTRQFKQQQIKLKGKIFSQHNLNRSGDLNNNEILLHGIINHKAIKNTRKY